jgi:hypothetical protein
MKRQELFLSVLFCAISGSPTSSQETSNMPAFPGTKFRPYFRCLPDYLSRLAGGAARQRAEALARLTSPAAIHERQAWARKALWNLIGGKPDDSPLRARVTGRGQGQLQPPTSLPKTCPAKTGSTLKSACSIRTPSTTHGGRTTFAGRRHAHPASASRRNPAFNYHRSPPMMDNRGVASFGQCGGGEPPALRPAGGRLQLVAAYCW